jgi:CSLREA domain-containing protein
MIRFSPARLRGTFLSGCRAALVLAGFVCLLAAPAWAQYTVTNTNDSGAGSLRYGIDSNATVINFAAGVTGTITLSSANGALNLTTPVVINGPGAGSLTISGGGGAFNIFGINTTGAVKISGLTIASGGGYYESPGVYLGGALTINNGTVTADRCTFSGNSAQGGYGGAIFMQGPAASSSLTVTNSTFFGNSSPNNGNGGAVAIQTGSTAVLSGDTFYGNSSDTGGAIVNFGTLTLTDDTFFGNRAYGTSQPAGGAIYNAGTLKATNNSFSRNNAPTGYGGAIYNQTTFSVDNNNVLTGDGGGECSGLSCPTNGTDGNIVSVTSVLLPLSWYGGPTQTMLPPMGSPVVCGGSAANATSAGVTHDQRGNGMHQCTNNSLVDAGATQLNIVATVVGTGDTNDGSCTSSICTLRDAITAAMSSSNVNKPGVEIAFDPTLTENATSASPVKITLGSTLPEISGPPVINIMGTAANLLSVSGNGNLVFDVASGATASLNNLTITGGVAQFGGGAGAANAGTLTVNDSTVLGNTAYGTGGGIDNSGTLAVNNSTFSGNTAATLFGLIAGTGGGIYNSGTLTVSNSTFTANSTTGYGGGIYNGATAAISNSTFSANSATSAGGGIDNSGTLTLSNTIVSADTGGDISGSYTTGGVNLVGGTAQLNALGWNGGQTQTMDPNPNPLGGGSSVTGKGLFVFGEAATDQRGAPRPATVGGAIDIGAVQTTSEPAVIGSVTPNAGPSAGGTTVTITGSGFQRLPTVYFGSTASSLVSIISDSVMTARSPAGSAGTVDITAGNIVMGLSTTSAADLFTYLPVPAVTSVSPSSGPQAGGTSVTISGTSFTDATAVKFGTKAATSFSVVSASEITAVAPSGTAGTVDITVTTPGGTSPTNVDDEYSYIPAPTVTSVSPSVGGTAGGTTVTITGTSFTGATAVKFGATAATNVTVNSSTSITATSPSGSAGTVNITVITPGGTSATNTGDDFVYEAAPTVTKIAPAVGPINGGTSVTITGTNFTGASAVMFGANAATNVTVTSSTSITATSPSGSAGNVDVTVTAPGGKSTTSAKDQFTYEPTPTVTSVSPTSGLLAGSTSVKITGTNFTGATAVSFGGTAAASFSVTNSTTITATSPAGSAGTVNITVTAPGGTSSITTGDQFTYQAAPTVTAINPSYGTTQGGTTVTITGTNFTGATAVKFGTTAAASYTVASATSITATAPAGTGTVDIMVTTASGTSATSAADQFTYQTLPTVTAVNPSSGPLTGGTTVTIGGTNFTGATAVKFGTISATSFSVTNATSITATAPAGSAGTVNITVTTANGTSAVVAQDQFTYEGAPTVTAISPTMGGTAGGTSVTITGTNFTGATAVKFGATAATSFTVNSATSITATSPSGSAGMINITVTTPIGTSPAVTADQFTYLAAPTVTSVSPISGPLAGGTSVSITGTNFTGATAVKFGTTAATSFTVNSATSLSATSPAGSAGAVNITVTAPGGTSATGAGNQFTYVSVPAVSAINPSSGTSAGGTSVTITGTNFTGATAVNFGTTVATSFTVNSSTSITATSPAGSAGKVDITVTAPGGTSAAGTQDQFTYIAAPTVLGINPTGGTAAGGVQVNIFGTNFTGATAVKFGTAEATSFTVNSSGFITATAPAGTGTVDVTVAAPGGTSATSAADQFTYLLPAIITVVGGSPQTAYVGAPLANALQVKVINGSGIAVPGVTVNFAAPGSGASATLSRSSAVTGSNGVASVTATANATTGNYSVTAGVTGLSSVSFSLTNQTEPAYVVTTLVDDVTGDADKCNDTSQGALPLIGCSLRDAIAAAAAMAANIPGTMPAISFAGTQSTGLGAITFGPGVTGTITLNSGLKISGNMSIAGPGPNLLTVSGNSTFPILYVNGGVTAAISGLTVTKGYGVYSINADGGGIINKGTLTLSNSTISGNSGGNSGSGAGIANSGALTVINSTFSGNITAAGFGGGIMNFNTLTVSNSTFSGNSALSGYDGGGIHNDGTLTVSNSTFSGNIGGLLGGGGGIGNSGTMTLNNSIVSGNSNGNVTGSYNSGGVNLVGGTSGLSALGWYGGPTQTMVPLSGSAALGAGSFLSGELATDQRGASRPSTTGAAIDIGAVQVTGNGPMIGSVTPNLGPLAGGTSVAITGTGFAAATAVDFGATAATNFSVHSAISITATAPAEISGTVDIGVTAGGKTSAASTADEFTYEAAPTVTAVSPSAGSSAGGTIVAITGSGFTGTTAVKFGTTAATSFTVDSPTSITALAPAGAGTVDITIVTTIGTSATSASDQYTFETVPAVTAISPTSGPAAGGTSVTIAGANFTGATAVDFGAIAATSFTVINPTTITATSPAGAGTVDVTVTTPAGTSSTSAADQFTYQAAPTVTAVSPSDGATTGGASITITGTHFTGATAVEFGATPATSFTINSATSITATSPAGTGTVDITVTATGGTSATSAADQFTYVVPLATALSTTTPSVNYAYGEPPTISVTLAPPSATGIVPGNITATLDTTIPLTVTAGTGINTFNITVPTTVAVGTHSIAVAFTGTGEYTASTLSPPISLTVTAPSLVVNNTGDGGSGASDCPANPTTSGAGNCTLRDAIAAAAAIQGGSITFDPAVFGTAQTITLNSSLTISGNMSITGPGANLLAVSGNSAFPVFEVNKGVTASISGVTVTKGYGVYSISADGGGIFNWGTLTVSNCTISGNSGGNTGSGGGIASYGTLTVINSTISGNSTTAYGGGIFNAYATLTVINSTFSGNTAGAEGGAIHNDATLAVSNSTFSGNTGGFVGGGGIGNPGTLTLKNSIVAGNSGGDVKGTYSSGGVNLVGGTPGLSALGNYGGPTQTLLPLPGSAAICAGSASTAAGAGITSDQRGVTMNLTTANAAAYTGVGGYCPAGSIDIGAVQTDYALSFSPSTGNPAAQQAYGVAFPATVLVTESGNPVNGASVPVTLTANTSGATLASSPAYATTLADGTATYSVTVNGTGMASGLSLTASMPAPVTLTAASNSFTVYGVPTVSLVSPNSGSQSGGTAVTITGTNFAFVSGMNFGGTAATSFTVISDTSIAATSPAGTPGAVDITVVGTGGTSATNTGDKFTYLSQLSQTISFANPGTQTVGTPLALVATATSNLGVTFKSDTTSVCTVSGTKAQFLISGSCTIEAIQAGNTSYAAAPEVGQTFSVSYAVPTATGVTPNSGLQSGGTKVVITGTHFTGATAVMFGSSAAASFTVNSDTSITATAPAEVPGVVNMIVTAPGGTCATGAANDFTYLPLAFTMTIVGPSSQTVVPGSTITYQVTVDPAYGNYAGTVNFTVAGQPPNSTVTFSPTSITASGGKQTITVTIQIPAIISSVQTPPRPASGRKLQSLTLAFLLLFGIGGLRRRGKQLRRLLCIAILVVAGGAATLIGGCGGGGYFDQAPHTYTITVTATAGTVVKQATFTLNVQ